MASADLLLPLLAVGSVVVLRGALEHWRAIVSHETAAKVQLHLRRLLFAKVAELGPGYVAQQRSGDVTLSLVDGVEQLETYFGQYIPQLTVSMLTPLLIFAFIAWLDFVVAAVVLVFAFIALFAPAIWHHLDARKSIERRRAYGAFAAEAARFHPGFWQPSKPSARASPGPTPWRCAPRDLFRSTMWVLATNSLGRGITDSSIAVGAAAALGVGAFRVAAGDMELSALLVILMLGVEVYRPMRDLRTVLHQGMNGLSAAQGIYRLLDGEPQVLDADAATVLPVSVHLSPDIAFENVTFGYPGNNRTTHRNLSFEVSGRGARRHRRAERLRQVVHCAPVYCATTIPTPATSVSAATACATCRSPPSAVRSPWCRRTPTCSTATSKTTSAWAGRTPRTDDVVAAASAANIHGFVMSLPDGYQTLIGEKGIKLSGGQRQRVAIARALLRDAPILVLDEALSAVDAENEAVIQDALARLMRDRTVLILAHRLSSVIDCDRILALDDGHIVESGDHAALMAAGNVYHRLMAEQVRDTDAVSQQRPRQRRRPQAADRRRHRAGRRRSGGGPPDGGHSEGRGHGVARGGLGTAAAHRAVEGQADAHLPVRRAARGRLHRRRRAERPRHPGAENRPAVHRLPVGAGRGGAAGRRAALAGKLDGARHGLPPARRDAHRFLPQAGSNWRPPTWCGGAPAI